MGAQSGATKLSPEDEWLMSLINWAGSFRQDAAGDIAKALTLYETGASLSFVTEGARFKEKPEIWAYFFAGSVVAMGHTRSSAPVAAYYNPFLDGVLLTQWEWKEDGSMKMTGADLQLGGAYGGTGEQKVARWLTAGKAFPTALGEQYRGFVKAFEAKYPPLSDAKVAIAPGAGLAAAQDLIERQAEEGLSNTMEVQVAGAPRYNVLLVNMLKALAASDRKAIDRMLPKKHPMSSKQLLALPEKLRKDLAPVYALFGKEKTWVFVVWPMTPRFYALAQYANGPQGAASLDYFLVYDMESAK
jgi:hypothetical protein